MKACLIDTSYLIEVKTRIPKEFKHILPNMGLLYIAAILRKYGIEVRLIAYYSSLMRNGYNEKSIIETLKMENPDFVLLSSTVVELSTLKIVIKRIRKELLNSKLILGGAMATAVPEIIFDEIPEIDFIVLHEGEETIVDLLNKLYSREDYSRVKGIAYKENNKIYSTEKRELITDLDALPFPSWDLVDFSRIKLAPTAHYIRGKDGCMITSRGCPFNCIFCDKSIFGSSWRGRSAQNMFAEIKLLYYEYKVRNILFFDDLFLFDQRRIIDICKLIKQEGLDFAWTCQSRVDVINSVLLKEMKEAGCRAIGYGIETGSPKILKLIDKHTTLEQAEHAINETKKIGIETKCFFMFGFPSETEEDILDTVKYAIFLNPDFAIFAIVVPYPGTKLWNMLKDSLSRDWSKFISYGGVELVYTPKNFSGDKLDRLHRYALRRYYLRPIFLWRTIFKFVRNPYRFFYYSKHIKPFIFMMSR